MEDKDLIINEDDFVSPEEEKDYSYGPKQTLMASDDELCKKQPAEKTQKNNQLISVTRTEAILMFVFTVLLIGVLCFVCNRGLTEKIERLNAEIGNLEIQMAVINQQITDKTVSEKEPINITVNVDGNKTTHTVDPSNPESTDPTQPSTEDEEVEFDTSPFLGVAFFSGNDGSQNPIGLQIDFVYESSPAALAGLKAGDIIMAVNGYEIQTLDNLTAVLAKCKAKDIIDINIASSSEAGIVCTTYSIELTYKGNFDLD